MCITRCAARNLFGNQAGHNAQPLDSDGALAVSRCTCCLFNECLKLCLEDDAALKLLLAAAELVAQGDLPKVVQDAMRLSQLTAILKESGRVCGISAGDTFRRLVGKCLARQFAEQLRQAAGPANFGMSTRCGTDGLVHLARAPLESDPAQTTLCIDGAGVFDHVSRARMFERLLATPSLRPILPFVRLWYSSPSETVWANDAGSTHVVSSWLSPLSGSWRERCCATPAQTSSRPSWRTRRASRTCPSGLSEWLDEPWARKGNMRVHG